jgi:Animal haem peroxidase/Peptidase M10 serralysin C terminal
MKNTNIFREIDGSNNNLANPDLNSTGSSMVRVGEAHFNSGGSPIETVNPRVVSNNIVGEGDAAVPNAEGLSGMMYAWGQFIDHDLDLVTSDGVNHIDINIPADDQTFEPGSVIPLTRSIVDDNGFSINQITGWLDGSQIYGSTQEVADSLRGAGGHLKTSAGDNLPLNPDGTMAAGDVRAQENPSLTALQTLFVREHNYQVDKLHKEHPNWDAEHLYQQARAIVSGEIANITYNEFLPHLLGQGFLAAYHGYDPTVDATISEEFAGAAYRWGHSTVSNETERVDNNGVAIGPELELKDTFFLPADQFNAFTGTDGFLRHLGTDLAQAMDGRIVDGLRNFLFDPPVGQDLAAINIQRGHDLGLGTLNETRIALGLAPYTSFEQLTDDPGTLAGLHATFTNIDQVDLWTGGLSERHMANGSLIGETFAHIVGDQFEALRDGDRFYFENALDQKTVAEIKGTTLSDLIERDTATNVMQADAFVFAERHTSDVAAEHPGSPQLIIATNIKATVVGGSADDTLVAGPGKDKMTGNDGADIFNFNAHTKTQATVTDFERGVDHIQIDDIKGKHDTFRDLDISQNRAGDVVIDIGQTHIVLQGVHQVSSSDFIFG